MIGIVGNATYLHAAVLRTEQVFSRSSNRHDNMHLVRAKHPEFLPNSISYDYLCVSYICKGEAAYTQTMQVHIEILSN